LEDELSLFKKIVFSARNSAVTTIVGPDLGLLRCWLENETLPNQQRPILLLDRIARIPSLEDLLNDYIRTLADAAFRLWPVWYTDVDLSRFDTSAASIRGIHTVFEAVAAQDDKISVLWARKALVSVLNAHLPIVTDFSRGEQLRQLALAIHRHGVILVLGLEDARKRTVLAA
jgi:hypothetical protein